MTLMSMSSPSDEEVLKSGWSVFFAIFFSALAGNLPTEMKTPRCWADNLQQKKMMSHCAGQASTGIFERSMKSPALIAEIDLIMCGYSMSAKQCTTS